HNIINQPCTPHIRRHCNQRSLAYIVNWIECVSIHNRDIVHAHFRLLCEYSLGCVDQSVSIHFTFANLSFHTFQRTRKHQRLLPLCCIEVGIARTHSQTIRLANNRPNHNLNRQIQITHHALDDCHLCSVLLPEECLVRFNDMEEL